VSNVKTGLGITAAAAVLALFAFGAEAQQKAPDKAAPKAAAQPKCNSIKEEAGCTGRTDCSWVGESKDAKGKTRKAYCRSKPKQSAKKEPAKK